VTWRALSISPYRKGSSVGDGGTGCLSCNDDGDVAGRCKFRVSGLRFRLTPGCPRVGHVWGQHLKLKHHELCSKISFNFNLRRYRVVAATMTFVVLIMAFMLAVFTFGYRILDALRLVYRAVGGAVPVGCVCKHGITRRWRVRLIAPPRV